MDTKEFFEAVYANGTGYAVLTTDLASVGEFFSYPDDIDRMVRYVSNHAHEQVYFSPVLFSEKARRKEFASEVAVAYADSDLMPPSGYRVEPSITVQTADGRTHNYWLLDKVENPHTVALLNRRAHWAHKDEGVDRSFGHAAKMLRVPGTRNTNRSSAVFVSNVNDKVYSLAELEAAYPYDGNPEKSYGTIRPLPESLPQRMEILQRIPNNKVFDNLIFDEPVPGKRSEMRWKLEAELFRAGFTAEEVLVIVWDAPCCKFKQENRGMGQLWNEILNAEVDPRNQPHVSAGVSELETEQPVIVLHEAIEEVEFLTPAERLKLSVTFIDKYEAWATGLTTSPAKYHRTIALTIMSVVYSEYGYVPFEFQKTGLNLWFMVLGNTTVDRKTTALHYGVEFLESLETPDYEYSIGSDVTQQGLNKALAEKPNRSSLLHADEVQDVFREVFNQGYLTGLVGYWTQLYSGKSRGTLRSTGDKQNMKAVPVHFQMYLTGIINHVTDVLTVKNFESGFLTRFLYVVVEPRPYDPAGDLLKQSTATNTTYVDPVRLGLVTHIQTVRNYWAMQTDRDQPWPIRFDDDALDRLNEFIITLKRTIMKNSRFDTLKGPIERLGISVGKTAALFAMDDKRNVISLEDVLTAIDLAEEWYYDLVTIAAMVSESVWQRDLNALEHFIASKGGKIAFDKAYAQFPEKRPMEFKELVDGLEDMGRVHVDKRGAQVTLEIIYANNP